MDLHLVSYFVAVVDHGGITRAAQSLYISQPSLSQAIRTLERRLGTTLFDRTGRRLVLTADGEVFDEWARRILADVDRAKARVASVRDLGSGRVDIVTHAPFSIDPLVRLVARFHERFPALVVNVIDADGPFGVLSALRRGEAEVGITDLTANAEALQAHRLPDQELVVAIPSALNQGPAAPDATDGPLPIDVLRTVPLVADLTDKGGWAILTGLLGADADNVIIDCENTLGIWDLVRRGAAAAVLPRTIAERVLGSVPLHTTEPPLSRSVALFTRAGDRSPAAEAFLSCLDPGLPRRSRVIG